MVKWLSFILSLLYHYTIKMETAHLKRCSFRALVSDTSSIKKNKNSLAPTSYTIRLITVTVNINNSTRLFKPRKGWHHCTSKCLRKRVATVATGWIKTRQRRPTSIKASGHTRALVTGSCRGRYRYTTGQVRHTFGSGNDKWRDTRHHYHRLFSRTRKKVLWRRDKTSEACTFILCSFLCVRATKFAQKKRGHNPYIHYRLTGDSLPCVQK